MDYIQRERTQIISSRVKSDDTKTDSHKNSEQSLFHVRLQILFFTTEREHCGNSKNALRDCHDRKEANRNHFLVARDHTQLIYFRRKTLIELKKFYVFSVVFRAFWMGCCIPSQGVNQ